MSFKYYLMFLFRMFDHVPLFWQCFDCRGNPSEQIHRFSSRERWEAEPSAEWDELLPLLCWALDVEAQRNLGPSTERPVRFWMALIDR